jgi:hypothetical protein
VADEKTQRESKSFPFEFQQSSLIYRELDPFQFIQERDALLLFVDLPIWYREGVRRFVYQQFSVSGGSRRDFPIYRINDWLLENRIVPDSRFDAGFIGVSLIIKDKVPGLEKFLNKKTVFRLINTNPSQFSRYIEPYCPSYRFGGNDVALYRHMDLIYTMYRIGDRPDHYPKPIRSSD